MKDSQLLGLVLPFGRCGGVFGLGVPLYEIQGLFPLLDGGFVFSDKLLLVGFWGFVGVGEGLWLPFLEQVEPLLGLFFAVHVYSHATEGTFFQSLSVLRLQVVVIEVTVCGFVSKIVVVVNFRRMASVLIVVGF